MANLWRESLVWLRSVTTVPAALRNASVLSAARPRWETAVVARTSMHDLLFTRPGDEFPFSREVRVNAAAETFLVSLTVDGDAVGQWLANEGRIDELVDEALEQLVAPLLVCRRCGVAIDRGRADYDVLERMHYVCFHYEFEHGVVDPDVACTAGGCPAACWDSGPLA